MAPAAQLQALAEQLQADPSPRHAAQASKLLEALQADNEALARSAVQALKLFFITACDEGSIPRKRARTDGAAAAAPSTNPAAAAAPSEAAERLSADYTTFVSRLLRLLAGSSSKAAVDRSNAAGATSPGLQVAALVALMECARHEEGPGACSGRLVGAVIEALALGGGASPEAFALLSGRYLTTLDVRYHALRAAARCARRLAAAGGARGGSAAGEQQKQQREQEEEAAAAAEAAFDVAPDGAPLRAAAADAARALFDVLTHIDPVKPGDDLEQATSWCGAAEAGLVVAAADASASSKARRKRKAALAAAGGDAAAAAAAAAAAWASPKAQQRAYGEAWLAFLRLDLPADIYRKVLIRLHSHVIGAMTDPALLADFLTASLDRGGLEGMLALNGIFTLVTRHGLEYPAFYRRLYCLITPEAFLSKHRVQFFKLADVFLASGLVPAYTAAAFAKRFARLALRAPPSGAMVAIAFVHNLLRRHPSCMVLLHRPTAAPSATTAGKEQSGKEQSGKEQSGKQSVPSSSGQDPYNEDEPDPAHSRAVESSLWELEALRRHYNPQVATFASVLDKDLGDRAITAEVDLDPLLAASYSSLIQSEASRRLKAAPVAFYAKPPAALFGGGGVGGMVVGEGEGEDEGRASEAAARAGNASLLAALPGWDVAAV